MSREEALNKAIGVLTYHQVNFCKSKEAVANMNEIIDALEKIDQEPCDDVVNRQAVLDLVADYDLSMGKVVKGIHALPSVSPQPKMGRWITWKEAGNDIPSETRFECSVCHDAAQTLCNGMDLLSTYCPNCGAKMSEIPTGSEKENE